MDNSPLSFVNWADGEPEHQTNAGLEVCVQMDGTGNWYDIACWHHRPYICSKDIGNSDSSLD